jgi:hypothetical protein
MVSPVRTAGMVPYVKWSRPRQYCRAIFTATSTDTDPESQKTTVSAPTG